MSEWLKDHAEWALASLGTVAMGVVGYCIKLVRKVHFASERVMHLEGALGQHSVDDQKAHEEIIGLKYEMKAVKDDILEVRDAHKNLALEVRAAREENRLERAQLLTAILNEFKALRESLQNIAPRNGK